MHGVRSRGVALLKGKDVVVGERLVSLSEGDSSGEGDEENSEEGSDEETSHIIVSEIFFPC